MQQGLQLRNLNLRDSLKVKDLLMELALIELYQFERIRHDNVAATEILNAASFQDKKDLLGDIVLGGDTVPSNVASLSSQMVDGMLLEGSMSVMANVCLLLNGECSVRDAVKSVFQAVATGALRGAITNGAHHLAEVISRDASVGVIPGSLIFCEASFLGKECIDSIKSYCCGRISFREMALAISANTAKSAAAVGGMAVGHFISGLVLSYFRVNSSLLQGVLMGGGYLAGKCLANWLQTWVTDMERWPLEQQREFVLARAYEVLGLPPAAGVVEVRRRYLELAIEHHPDRGGTHDRMVEIGLAYEIVRNAQAR